MGFDGLGSNLVFTSPLETKENLCHDGFYRMRWLISPVDSEKVSDLARALGLSTLVARLLFARGIKEPEAAHRSLHPTLDQLHDPFLMADMPAAVERLRRAIDRKERILIYGDYDVDGTMAVVVLMTTLRACGANVEAYIPHRLNEGYGMRQEVVERAASQGVNLILSVDTGVREHAIIGHARELGIDCIVTDHHLPDDHLPPAYAVLNPRRTDCRYPDKHLSGVGVAFKVVQALLGSKLSDRTLLSYLKVVALGTIADVVPLLGENRVIAYYGLAGLGSAQSGGPGLGALLATVGLEGRAVSAGDVAFRIAPRLNAAGRMENARDVIELFTTQDVSAAREIAEKLDRLNRERQRVEDGIVQEIARLVDGNIQDKNYSLVFSNQGWHRGVIGIVAQRVVERYYRPTLVIGVKDGVGQGSGRSIPGFHLLQALTSVGDLFDRYGGHASAAGFTLPANRIQELEQRFESYAQSVLRLNDLEPVLRVDAEMDLAQIDRSLYEQLQKLEPHGVGNPTPVFVSRQLLLSMPPRILQDKHLKLKVSQNGKTFDALGWGRAGRAATLSPGKLVDLAFTVDANVFRAISTLQLIIKDIRDTDELS